MQHYNNTNVYNESVNMYPYNFVNVNKKVQQNNVENESNDMSAIKCNNFANQKITKNTGFIRNRAAPNKIINDNENMQPKVLNSTEHFYKIHNYINNNLPNTTKHDISQFTKNNVTNYDVYANDKLNEIKNILDNKIENNKAKKRLNTTIDKKQHDHDIGTNKMYNNTPYMSNNVQKTSYKKTKKQKSNDNSQKNNNNKLNTKTNQDTIFNHNFLQSFNKYINDENMSASVNTNEAQYYDIELDNVSINEAANNYEVNNDTKTKKKIKTTLDNVKRTYKKKGAKQEVKTNSKKKAQNIKTEDLQNNATKRTHAQDNYKQNIFYNNNINNTNYYTEESNQIKFINAKNTIENENGYVMPQEMLQYDVNNHYNIEEQTHYAAINQNTAQNMNFGDEKNMNAGKYLKLQNFTNSAQCYDAMKNGIPENYTMDPDEKKNEIFNNMNIPNAYNNQYKMSLTNLLYKQNTNHNYMQNNPIYINQNQYNPHYNHTKNSSTQISEEEQNQQLQNLQYQQQYINDGSGLMYDNLNQANYNNIMRHNEMNQLNTNQNMTIQNNQIHEHNNMYNIHPQDQYFGMYYQQNAPPQYNMYGEVNYKQNTAQPTVYDDYNNVQNNLTHEQDEMYMNESMQPNIPKQHYFINEEFNIKTNAETYKMNGKNKRDNKSEEKTSDTNTILANIKENAKTNSNSSMLNKRDSTEKKKGTAKHIQTEEKMSFFDKTTPMLRSDTNDDAQKDTRKLEDLLNENNLTDKTTRLVTEMCDIIIDKICNTACLITKGKGKSYLNEEDIKQAFFIENYYEFVDQAFDYKPEPDIEHEKRVLTIQKDNKNNK
ncbi:hypothetical protein BDAP_002514 [Binucleata daphniae]